MRIWLATGVRYIGSLASEKSHGDVAAPSLRVDPLGGATVAPSDVAVFSAGTSNGSTFLRRSCSWALTRSKSYRNCGAAGVVGCCVVGLLVVFPSAMAFSPRSPTFGLNLMARPEPWRLLDVAAGLSVVVTWGALSFSVVDGGLLSRAGGAGWKERRLGGFDGVRRGAAVV